MTAHFGPRYLLFSPLGWLRFQFGDNFDIAGKNPFKSTGNLFLNFSPPLADEKLKRQTL